MKKVLVTGGMGYIGSHTMQELSKKGYAAYSMDNFCNSSGIIQSQLATLIGYGIKNYTINILNEEQVDKVFEKEKFDFVIHLAAYKSIPESLGDPVKYYQNNISGLLTVLKMCDKYRVKRFVFSSSCSVYGENVVSPVDETTPVAQEQLSPYSLTKKVGEDIVRDFARSSKIECVNLRYFNPAGADLSGLLGELNKEESPVIPNLVRRASLGESFQLYGSDYETRDGSCIRDFIHVSDLAIGHINSLEYSQKAYFETFNLGSGKGITVLEVINALQKIFPGTHVEFLERREGDIPAIYSNNRKAKEVLGWYPKLGISEMLDSEVKWQKTFESLSLS
ncbi:MAG: UDP-glucose 4-epimerase GalE [Marinoscillum sp.]